MKPEELIREDGFYSNKIGSFYAKDRKVYDDYEKQDCVLASINGLMMYAFLIKSKRKYMAFLIPDSRLFGWDNSAGRLTMGAFMDLLNKTKEKCKGFIQIHDKQEFNEFLKKLTSDQI